MGPGCDRDRRRVELVQLRGWDDLGGSSASRESPDRSGSLRSGHEDPCGRPRQHSRVHPDIVGPAGDPSRTVQRFHGRGRGGLRIGDPRARWGRRATSRAEERHRQYDARDPARPFERGPIPTSKDGSRSHERLLPHSTTARNQTLSGGFGRQGGVCPGWGQRVAPTPASASARVSVVQPRVAHLIRRG